MFGSAVFRDAAAPLQDLPCGRHNKNVLSTYLVPTTYIPQLILFAKFYSQIKTILFVRYFFLILLKHEKTDFLFNCKNNKYKFTHTHSKCL